MTSCASVFLYGDDSLEGVEVNRCALGVAQIDGVGQHLSGDVVFEGVKHRFGFGRFCDDHPDAVGNLKALRLA